MSETKTRQNNRKFIEGVVVSDKMNKTRVVQVTRSTMHSRYHKIVMVFQKFKAHDEKNESKMGDVVRLMETRRLSKDKRWTIREIVETAKG